MTRRGKGRAQECVPCVQSACPAPGTSLLKGRRPQESILLPSAKALATLALPGHPFFMRAATLSRWVNTAGPRRDHARMPETAEITETTPQEKTDRSTLALQIGQSVHRRSLQHGDYVLAVCRSDSFHLDNSHSSMQFRWKTCPQGSRRTF